MEKNAVKDAVFEAVEASLDAQLKAIRRLRREPALAKTSKEKGMSQLDMAKDILEAATRPMHVTSIIEQIEKRFSVKVDRESLVSALSKRVARQDRFERTARNTFALRGGRGR